MSCVVLCLKWSFVFIKGIQSSKTPSLFRAVDASSGQEVGGAPKWALACRVFFPRANAAFLNQDVAWAQPCPQSPRQRSPGLHVPPPHEGRRSPPPLQIHFPSNSPALRTRMTHSRDSGKGWWAWMQGEYATAISHSVLPLQTHSHLHPPHLKPTTVERPGVKLRSLHGLCGLVRLVCLCLVPASRIAVWLLPKWSLCPVICVIPTCSSPVKHADSNGPKYKQPGSCRRSLIWRLRCMAFGVTQQYLSLFAFSPSLCLSRLTHARAYHASHPAHVFTPDGAVAYIQRDGINEVFLSARCASWKQGPNYDFHLSGDGQEGGGRREGGFCESLCILCPDQRTRSITCTSIVVSLGCLC